jgi:quinol monooxygenase YgiN
MYGTIATLSIDPKNAHPLGDLLKKWNESEDAAEIGYVGGFMLQTDADSSIIKMMAVFEDEKKYRANAERPEQDAWYQQFRALLLADPIWDDGKVIAT